jgi:hypothetical protein
MTYMDGEVVAVDHDHPSGQPVATVAATMTTQTGTIMSKGKAEVLLPAV